MVTNARAALTRAGSQSGTVSRKPRRPAGGRPGASTSSASPSSTCNMPSSTLAVSSASSRSDGVRAGSASSVRAACSQARRSAMRIGHPARRRARLPRGSQLRRDGCAGWTPPAGRLVLRQAAQMGRNCPPTIQRAEQAVDGGLQYRRVVAHFDSIPRALGRSSGRAR